MVSQGEPMVPGLLSLPFFDTKKVAPICPESDGASNRKMMKIVAWAMPAIRVDVGALPGISNSPGKERPHAMRVRGDSITYECLLLLSFGRVVKGKCQGKTRVVMSRPDGKGKPIAARDAACRVSTRIYC